VHRLFLAKGALATTAIEGNTLSEKQALEYLDGKLELPRSKQYLQQELANVVDACNAILVDIQAGTPIPLTPERICALNAAVLNKLELKDGEGIVPGHLRQHSVGVAHYRGAPHEDCAYLLRRLTDWLNGPAFRAKDDRPDRVIVNAILKAILAHLYLAWIHPFGDGNGRTARLVEFEILVQAGVPSPAAHLLSNFYNETRSKYYAQLDFASKSNGNVIPFMTYAVEGFVDGLRDQLALIRNQQWDVTWRNYVHEIFKDRANSEAEVRQKHLILDLSKDAHVVSRAGLRNVSARVAASYATKGDRTLTRDINSLLRMKLLVRRGPGFVANRDLILAFLPIRHVPDIAPESEDTQDDTPLEHVGTA
jgi:Fic family protein